MLFINFVVDCCHNIEWSVEHWTYLYTKRCTNTLVEATTAMTDYYFRMRGINNKFGNSSDKISSGAEQSIFDYGHVQQRVGKLAGANKQYQIILYSTLEYRL